MIVIMQKEPQSLSKNTYYATGAGDRVCLKVIPVTKGNKVTHTKVETYALLDNCSDVTLCSDGLVSELMMDGKKDRIFVVNSEQ